MFGLGFCSVFNFDYPSSGRISFRPLHLHRKKHRNSSPSSKHPVADGKFSSDCLNSGLRPHYQDRRNLIYPPATTPTSKGQWHACHFFLATSPTRRRVGPLLKTTTTALHPQLRRPPISLVTLLLHFGAEKCHFFQFFSLGTSFRAFLSP